MMEQVAGFYRRRAGAWVVTAISDGAMNGSVAMMPNIAPEEASALLAARFRGPQPLVSVNAFLVQGEGRTVLIDTGAGSNMGESCGRLLRNMAAAGVGPGEVDLVLLTHFHPDHSGGLATAGGEAVFPRAELVYPAAEGAFWFDEAAERAAPEARRGGFAQARAAALPYRGRSRGLEGVEVVPGITRVALPGHTPGHSGYRIGEGADAVLIWGDIMHVPDVQSARPDVVVGFDLDPVQAVASRRAVLEMAATERLAVAGMHLHFPAFSHVARAGQGYELVPEQWAAVLEG